jgi:GNAT superfamily N-acetyltransferase
MEAALRPAAPQDARAVARVLIESRLAFLPFAPSKHPPHEVQAWTAEYLIPSGRVTVAEHEGKVVAVLATSERDHRGWIDQLYVLPGYERRGFGTQLLEHAHAHLPRPIHLHTFQANVGARRFYERFGYKAIEFTDGMLNEERSPDVLYELAAERAEA